MAEETIKRPSANRRIRSFNNVSGVRATLMVMMVVRIISRMRHRLP